MRFVSLVCLVSLRAAAQPCDPHGVMPPPFPEAEVPIELELFKDEVAARGVCTSEAGVVRFNDDVRSMLEASEQQSASLRCSGVCEPMHKKLSPLGETHDLEDLTFQKECGAAMSALTAEARPGCLRVCVVERRRMAAKAVWARTLRVLDRTQPYQGNAFDPKGAMAWLKAQGWGAPPSSIRFEAVGQKAERHVRAEGWLYPGGRRLRLKTAQMSAGCGLMAWGVTTW
ncbi:MAG: hypothetical protein ABTQ32_10845 [Myxococcaceae bacterium]